LINLFEKIFTPRTDVDTYEKEIKYVISNLFGNSVNKQNLSLSIIKILSRTLSKARIAEFSPFPPQILNSTEFKESPFNFEPELYDVEDIEPSIIIPSPVQYGAIFTPILDIIQKSLPSALESLVKTENKKALTFIRKLIKFIYNMEHQIFEIISFYNKQPDFSMLESHNRVLGNLYDTSCSILLYALRYLKNTKLNLILKKFKRFKTYGYDLDDVLDIPKNNINRTIYLLNLELHLRVYVNTHSSYSSEKFRELEDYLSSLIFDPSITKSSTKILSRVYHYNSYLEKVSEKICKYFLDQPIKIDDKEIIVAHSDDLDNFITQMIVQFMNRFQEKPNLLINSLEALINSSTLFNFKFSLKSFWGIYLNGKYDLSKYNPYFQQGLNLVIKSLQSLNQTNKNNLFRFNEKLIMSLMGVLNSYSASIPSQFFTALFDTILNNESAPDIVLAYYLFKFDPYIFPQLHKKEILFDDATDDTCISTDKFVITSSKSLCQTIEGIYSIWEIHTPETNPECLNFIHHPFTQESISQFKTIKEYFTLPDGKYDSEKFFNLLNIIINFLKGKNTDLSLLPTFLLRYFRNQSGNTYIIDDSCFPSIIMIATSPEIILPLQERILSLLLELKCETQVIESIIGTIFNSLSKSIYSLSDKKMQEKVIREFSKPIIDTLLAKNTLSYSNFASNIAKCIVYQPQSYNTIKWLIDDCHNRINNYFEHNEGKLSFIFSILTHLHKGSAFIHPKHFIPILLDVDRHIKSHPLDEESDIFAYKDFIEQLAKNAQLLSSDELLKTIISCLPSPNENRILFIDLLFLIEITSEYIADFYSESFEAIFGESGDIPLKHQRNLINSRKFRYNFMKYPEIFFKVVKKAEVLYPQLRDVDKSYLVQFMVKTIHPGLEYVENDDDPVKFNFTEKIPEYIIKEIKEVLYPMFLQDSYLSFSSDIQKFATDIINYTILTKEKFVEFAEQVADRMEEEDEIAFVEGCFIVKMVEIINELPEHIKRILSNLRDSYDSKKLFKYKNLITATLQEFFQKWQNMNIESLEEYTSLGMASYIT